MKKTVTLFAIVLFASACSFKIAVPTQVDADRIQDQYPGFTALELDKGRMLFEQNCQTCHAAKKSFGISDEILNKTVPYMVGKVNKRAGNTIINGDGKDQILAYLIAMNNAP